MFGLYFPSTGQRARKMALSLNCRAISPYCAIDAGLVGGVGFLGTAAEHRCEHAGSQPLQRSHDLPALYGGFVLELFGSLRTRRRPVSGDPARPDHGGGAAAEVLERAVGQPQHRGTCRRRPRLGRHGDDRRHAVPAVRYAGTHRDVPRARTSGGDRRPRCNIEPASLRDARISASLAKSRISSRNSSRPGSRAPARACSSPRNSRST